MLMSENIVKNDLLVIFGAGASFDCADKTKSSVNKEYRPPLTSQIFSRQYPLEDRSTPGGINSFKDSILNRHFFASSIGHEYNPNTSLEIYLSGLKISNYASDRKKYLALCIYLHDLFENISSRYLNASLDNNYHSLLLKLRKTQFPRINFLTTNYDTIFDATLEKLYTFVFQDLNDYLNFQGDGKTFNYIKAHGSINWSFLLNDQCIELRESDNIINGRINVNDDLMRSIESANLVKINHMIASGKIKFPAIAVPLGKYKFISPVQVENFLGQKLNVSHILIIGYSGRDNTIFDLLKKILTIPAPANIFIVDKDEENVVNVSDSFKKNLGEMIRPTRESINYFPGGFTKFINEHCDELLSRISPR